MAYVAPVWGQKTPFRTSFMKFSYIHLAWFLKLTIIMISADAFAVIPASHIKGINELFPSQFKIYSPINGLIYSKKFIPYFYHSNLDRESPTFQVLTALFTIIPGGEITFSHVAKNPASHLSGSAIAEIFSEVEKVKKSNLSGIALEDHLFQIFSSTIRNDKTYFSSVRQAEINIQKATEDYQNFLICYKNQKELTEKVDQVETTELIPLNRSITKLKKNKSNLTQEEQLSLRTLEERRTEIENQLRELKRSIITNEQMKRAEKSYYYKLQINDVKSENYNKALDQFILNLVKSFIHFELNKTLLNNVNHLTTYILLSYIWMKYDHKEDLRDYLERLAQIGFLKKAVGNNIPEHFYNDFFSKEELKIYKNEFNLSWFKQRWIRNHLSQSLVLISDLPQSTKYPDIVSFSYFKWITYSTFPDCCENTLHNFFNLIAFNPSTGKFDSNQLKKLKMDHYPNLNNKLISFYEIYPNPSDHQSARASSDWMNVVSNLNEGFETLTENCQVHYRNLNSHVASPYTNILKVIHRLMGFIDLTGDHLTEIFENLKEILGQEIQYDRSKIDDQGYGVAVFEIGDDRFQINSYRPVHMSFHQSKSSLDSNYQKLLFLVNLELQNFQFKIPSSTTGT